MSNITPTIKPIPGKGHVRSYLQDVQFTINCLLAIRPRLQYMIDRLRSDDIPEEDYQKIRQALIKLRHEVQVATDVVTEVKLHVLQYRPYTSLSPTERARRKAFSTGFLDEFIAGRIAAGKKETSS